MVPCCATKFKLNGLSVVCGCAFSNSEPPGLGQWLNSTFQQVKALHSAQRKAKPNREYHQHTAVYNAFFYFYFFIYKCLLFFGFIFGKIYVFLCFGKILVG